MPTPASPATTDAARPSADLIAEFRRASDRNKIGVIARLRTAGDFRAVLDLVQQEPARGLRQSQESFLVSRLSQMAGQHNSAGKIDDALQLLAVNLRIPRLQAAQLILLLTRDRLATEIESLRSQLTADSAAGDWRRLALLKRAAGDSQQAHAAAEQAGEHELAAWIAAEAGDWAAAVDSLQASYRGREATVKDLGLSVVVANHAGQPAQLAEALQKISRHVQSVPADAGSAVSALFIAEQDAHAIELLKRIAPGAAFEALWQRRDYDEAFRFAGVEHSDDIHALWYHTLPYGGVSSQFNVLRSGYAQRIALALADVGRAADADKILNLIRNSVSKRQDTSSAMAEVAEAEIHRGRRDQALADVLTAWEQQAKAPRVVPPPGRNYAYESSFQPIVLSKLYPGRDQLLRHAWPRFSALHSQNPALALDSLEQLFHPPRRASLTADQRQALFDELYAALPSDRSQAQSYLQDLARLAETHGDVERAYRYREQSLALYGASGQFATAMRGRQAFDRQDWQLAFKSWRPKDEAIIAGNSHLAQWGALHYVFDRPEEGKALLDKLTTSMLVETGYVTHAQTLVHAGKKAEAEEPFQTAMRVAVPGERSFFELAEDWGNAASGPSPATAARLWRLALLQSIASPPGRKLDVLLFANPRIHIAAARAHLAAGDIGAASREAERAQELMPASIHPATMLVPDLDKAGQRDLADQVFARPFQIHADFCRQYPASAYHRIMTARLAARCGRRLDEALAWLDEALAIEPARPIVHATRAEVHLARGDRNAAAIAAREGLLLEPGNVECQTVLAQAESADR